MNLLSRLSFTGRAGRKGSSDNDKDQYLSVPERKDIRRPRVPNKGTSRPVSSASTETSCSTVWEDKTKAFPQLPSLPQLAPLVHPPTSTATLSSSRRPSPLPKLKRAATVKFFNKGSKSASLTPKRSMDACLLPRLPSFKFDPLQLPPSGQNEGDPLNLADALELEYQTRQTSTTAVAPASAPGLEFNPSTLPATGFEGDDLAESPQLPPMPPQKQASPQPQAKVSTILDMLNVTLYPHIVDSILHNLCVEDLQRLRRSGDGFREWANSYLCYHLELHSDVFGNNPTSHTPQATIYRHWGAKEKGAFSIHHTITPDMCAVGRQIRVLTVRGEEAPCLLSGSRAAHESVVFASAQPTLWDAQAISKLKLQNVQVIRMWTDKISSKGIYLYNTEAEELVLVRNLPNTWPTETPTTDGFVASSAGVLFHKAALPSQIQRLVVNLQYDDKYCGGRFKWFASPHQLTEAVIVFNGPCLRNPRQTAEVCVRGIALAPILNEFVTTFPLVKYTFVDLDEFNPSWLSWTYPGSKDPFKGRGDANNTLSRIVYALCDLVATKMPQARPEWVFSTVSELVCCYTKAEYRAAVGEDQYHIDMYQEEEK